MKSRRSILAIYTILLLILLFSIIIAFVYNKNIIIEVLIIILLILITIASLNDDTILLEVIFLSCIFYIPIRSIIKLDISRYFIDYFIIIVLIKLLIKSKNKLKKNYIIPTILVLNITMIFINTISFFVERYSVYVFMNGIFYFYKYFVLFWGAVYLNIDKQRFGKFFKFIIVITLIQLPITFIQYITGADQDSIGGIFRTGGTGILMLFNFIGICFFTALIKYRKVTIKKYVLMISILLIPSILGEIKLTFIIMPVIFLFLFSEIRINYRNILILVFGILISYLSWRLLIRIYPSFATLFTDKDYFTQYTLKGSYGTYGLNRFNSILYIDSFALKTFLQKLFGIGIGRGTPSNFYLFVGDFFLENSMLKYEWFQFPYMLLENGYIGTMLYLLVIVLLAFFSKMKLSSEPIVEKKIILASGATFAVIHLINVFYNSVLLYYYGYLFWGLMGMMLNFTLKDDEVNYEKNFNY